MRLFSPEQINKKRQDQTRELMVKNEKLIGSLRKVLALQNDINYDADKAKKVKDYQTWCADLQEKMSKELANLKAYEKLTDDKKEEYYNLIARMDEIEDKILSKKEELGRITLQVKWQQEVLTKV